MRIPREQTELGSVYWMESSKRREALEWLRRGDLGSDERRFLEDFVERYRTSTRLTAGERRALLTGYTRLARRFRPAKRQTPTS